MEVVTESPTTIDIPKGYKRTKVGLLPKDWQIYCIPNLILASNGIKIGPFGSKLKKDLLVNSGYKVYGQENVFQKDIDIGNRYITKDHFRELSSCELIPGDFVISMMGTIGKCMIIPEDAESGIMDSHLLRLRLNESKLYPELLTHFFSSKIVLNQVSKLSVGGIMDGLSSTIVKKIEIPLPPTLEEQRAIAEALSDVDALIVELDALIEKKQQIKKGAMQQLLTGKKRLPGFESEWEKKKLENIAPLQRGYDLPKSKLVKGKFPVVYSNGIENYHNDFIDTGPGVVTGRSGTLGNVTFVEEDYWPHNTSLWVTSFKGNEPLFIYYLYTSIKLDRFGSGSGVPTLNRNDAHEFEIEIPSTIEEQKAIAQILSDIDAEIQALQTKRSKYKKIKQSMMQELLTGKTRLI